MVMRRQLSGKFLVKVLVQAQVFCRTGRVVTAGDPEVPQVDEEILECEVFLSSG